MFFILFFISIGSALSTEVPKELQGIGTVEKLGQNVDVTGLHFKDENGQDVTLSQVMRPGKPAFLALIYYECPNLCNILLNAFVDQIKKLDWSVGDQYDIIAVSIDPRETPEIARKKKESYLSAYGRVSARGGWHFLTGASTEINRLSEQVGFRFRWNEETKQFAHGAVMHVLTPEGKISRYLYGISFPTRDLKLSLLEASRGKVGSLADQVLLFCYKYQGPGHGYALQVERVMQLGAAFTLLILGGYLLWFWRRQMRASS